MEKINLVSVYINFPEVKKTKIQIKDFFIAKDQDFIKEDDVLEIIADQRKNIKKLKSLLRKQIKQAFNIKIKENIKFVNSKQKKQKIT